MGDAARYLLALGSNVGPSPRLLRDARARLAEDLEVVASSSLYANPAWGVTDQPGFVNGVCLVRAALPPQQLLAYLLEVEREFGRIRIRRWGPRALDLDILTWTPAGADRPAAYEGHGLTIPHPGIEARPFVLAPLLEIDPGWVHPTTGRPGRESWEALPAEERRAVQPLWRPMTGAPPLSEVPAFREHVHALGLLDG